VGQQRGAATQCAGPHGWHVAERRQWKRGDDTEHTYGGDKRASTHRLLLNAAVAAWRTVLNRAEDLDRAEDTNRMRRDCDVAVKIAKRACAYRTTELPNLVKFVKFGKYFILSGAAWPNLDIDEGDGKSR